jgi:hypothetical protein
MKKATLLSVFIAVACFTFARSNDEPGYSNDSTLIKIADVHDLLQQVMSVTGLNESFELKEANVLNIEATVKHRKRYILYNPAFITSLSNISRDKWAIVALLAHEVGHHLNGHTMRKGGSKPKLELEADEYAGFVLHKLGATLRQSQSVIYFISKEKGSRTHPARNARLSAIQKGWNKAARDATVKY